MIFLQIRLHDIVHTFIRILFTVIIRGLLFGSKTYFAYSIFFRTDELQKRRHLSIRIFINFSSDSNRQFKISFLSPIDNKLSTKQRERDIKTVNKRFLRVESHVVTLARSVAHLSSELRSQNALIREIEALRIEVNQLKDVAYFNHDVSVSSRSLHRPFVPQCANPQKIKKLTK